MVANCSHTDLLIQNHVNFIKSGPPVRLMYYENGSWCDFPADVADSLRIGFSSGCTVVEAVVGGVRCLFDLHRMVQIRLDGGGLRSVAWIDGAGNCFFPKRFFDGNSAFNCAIDGNGAFNGAEIELESPIVDGNGAFNGAGVGIKGAVAGGDKNEIEIKKMEVGIGLNEKILEGISSDSEAESARWPRVRVLSETENTYSAVKNLFLNGVRESDPKAIVTSIHRVLRSQPLDVARFKVFKQQIEVMKASRGGANLTFAWHGTSEKGVEGILKHGFSEVSLSGAHGVGVYLSPAGSAHASAMVSEADGNGEKHIILCQVVLGRHEEVGEGSQQMYPSNVDFDTGVDNIENPKWYVVWGAYMNTHILPECIVSYRPSNLSPDQLRGSSIVKTLPNFSPLVATLVAKLATSLPSSRVQEFQALCSAYKEGKMAKGYFLKQLRSVVGIETLLSAIREVRG